MFVKSLKYIYLTYTYVKDCLIMCYTPPCPVCMVQFSHFVEMCWMLMSESSTTSTIFFLPEVTYVWFEHKLVFDFTSSHGQFAVSTNSMRQTVHFTLGWWCVALSCEVHCTVAVTANVSEAVVTLLHCACQPHTTWPPGDVTSQMRLTCAVWTASEHTSPARVCGCCVQLSLLSLTAADDNVR